MRPSLLFVAFDDLGWARGGGVGVLRWLRGAPSAPAAASEAALAKRPVLRAAGLEPATSWVRSTHPMQPENAWLGHFRPKAEVASASSPTLCGPFATRTTPSDFDRDAETAPLSADAHWELFLPRTRASRSAANLELAAEAVGS